MDGIRRTVNLTTVIVFVIAFLLGYGTSARLVNRSGTAGERQGRAEMAAAEQTTATGEAQEESSLAQISAMIATGLSTVAADNQPAGKTVSVAVKLEKEAWVAVHEETNGAPGKILGAQLFTAGTHFGKVELLRGTVAGAKYYAMLHADDGDRKFDHAKDMPLKNAAGQAITDEFAASTAVLTQ